MLIDSQPKGYAALETMVSRSGTMPHAVASLTDRTQTTEILRRTRTPAVNDPPNTAQAKQKDHSPIHAILSHRQGSKRENFKNLRDLETEQLEIRE